MKTKPAICWGVRVGGPNPYIGVGATGYTKVGLTGKVPYLTMARRRNLRAVRVAIIPLAEYRRLVKLDKEAGGA